MPTFARIVATYILFLLFCHGIFSSGVLATSSTSTRCHKKAATAISSTGKGKMDENPSQTPATSAIEEILSQIDKYQQIRLGKSVDTTPQKVSEPIRSETPSQTKQERNKLVRRPFVLVTYAQTIDGMIATKGSENASKNAKTSSNLKLSSSESFQLTHALRFIHDGILIGGTTLSTDNPRLNNRLWFGGEESDGKELPDNQPVPIILDTRLENVMKIIGDENDDGSTNIIKAAESHNYIIVCCSHEALAKSQNGEENHAVHRIQRYCQSHNVRIELLPCNVNSGKLDLEDVLERLYSRFQLESVMVEGGATILSTFMSENNVKLVDCICITICPKVVGMQGLNALCGRRGDKLDPMLEFDPTSATWTTLGPDCIFLAPCLGN